MKPSAYYERIVDVMEELVRFTILVRPTPTNSWTAIPNARRGAFRSTPRPICHPSPSPQTD
jgi:hypothetical protein